MNDVDIPEFELVWDEKKSRYRTYMINDWPEKTRISQQVIQLADCETVQLLSAEPPIIKFTCENGSAVYRLSDPHDGMWQANLVRGVWGAVQHRKVEA